MKEGNENFIKIALEDLESSRILYENGKYPQSIFLLQQSVEKTTKGITGIFKYSHKTLNIYKEMVNDDLKEEMKFLENTPVDNEELFLAIIEVIKSLLSEIDSSKSNLKVGKITTKNFLLQQILSSHATSTRYPEGEYSPLTKYTKDYFLIKHYNKIYNFQKECLDECLKFI
ncbi:MAG: HEPN domain-containing protein [Nanoarchaeota archaeon]|nr:HEPN domain-containing protein [Nanoarchaeota archaeon]